MKTVLIFSGGADSTTLLYWLLNRGDDVYPITFCYGQRHLREIDAAQEICELCNVPFRVVDIFGFGGITNSALLGHSEIPHGHYQEESMKQTVVPNRNMIMLSIAASMAIANDCDNIAIGAHSGDHAIYPDCRRDFLTHVETAIWAGNWGKRPRVIAPFIKMDKGEIIRIGLDLNVPYHLTWTCYEGGEEPCGKCGSCVERDEAFRIAS